MATPVPRAVMQVMRATWKLHSVSIIMTVAARAALRIVLMMLLVGIAGSAADTMLMAAGLGEAPLVTMST